MAATYVFLAKPLTRRSTRASTNEAVLLNVAKHNLREIPVADADRSKSILNAVLAGPLSATAVVDDAWRRIKASGIKKVRKNAMLGIELVISLAPEAHIDCDGFFRQAIVWAEAYFCVPVISAVAHYDESERHVHVVLLPIREGRLTGAAIMGNRANLRAIRRDFACSVAKTYGLTEPEPRKLRTVTDRRRAAEAIIDAICANPRLLNDFGLRRALLNSTAKNPEPVIAALETAGRSLWSHSSKACFTLLSSQNHTEQGFDKTLVGNLENDHCSDDEDLSMLVLGNFGSQTRREVVSVAAC